MEPTSKQAERLRQLEMAIRNLDAWAETGRLEPQELKTAFKTIADALESLRILVAQTIDAL